MFTYFTNKITKLLKDRLDSFLGMLHIKMKRKGIQFNRNCQTLICKYVTMPSFYCYSL